MAGVMMITVLTTTPDCFAQDFETVLMPGKVIGGHAEIEAECSSCHVMFDKTAQRQRCMDCHEEVAADIAAKTGFHGLQAAANIDQCASCHTDHEGRDAVIVDLDADAFDHAFTDFALDGAHLDTSCKDCHADDKKYRTAPSDCAACHRDDTPHAESLDDDCGACHKSTEWSFARFDHDTTNYALLGKHQDTACLDCHEDHTFVGAPRTCYGCHQSDDAHDGRSGQKCESCHNPRDWHDSSFDHFRDTDFPLQNKHAGLQCTDCHSDKPFDDQLEMKCVGCHREDDAHKQHYGDECQSCHDSDEWQSSFFNHDDDTTYKLAGLHREVVCVDCHIEPIFEVKLETSCDACHGTKDPHEGLLGTSCESCHTEAKWQDPLFFDHDLTEFPLLGAHATTECDGCHVGHAFANDDTACASCHRDDDTHSGNLGTRCDTCHNPVAWDLWLFDHATQSDFALTGAHQGVACNDCHRSSLEKIRKIGGSCRDCHRSDDIHDGEFGTDCGRCHTVESFLEVRSLQ